MHKARVNGFGLEVTSEITPDGPIPHIRVCHGQSGEEVLRTNTLSVTGMERMGEVFATAARLAARDLEDFWQAKHAELDRERAAERRAAEVTHESL